ncbi:BON domain-containing protein [Opitutaceae bacterium TAV4]|nr:BON domain-containing protein [Opitutaceae bacterium TAV4]RRK00862.1 BON domain-containing protein [Opitutaceae bacterium TAV3]
MKTSFKSIALCALLCTAPGVLFFATGCASSSTGESTGEYVDNSAITAKVKTALLNDPIVKSFDVSVESYKGVVQLSGFVNTYEEKAQAGRVAAGVKGVAGVKNNLIVK